MIWVTFCIQSSVLQDQINASGQQLFNLTLIVQNNQRCPGALVWELPVSLQIAQLSDASWQYGAGSYLPIGCPALMSPDLHGSEAVPL